MDTQIGDWIWCVLFMLMVWRLPWERGGHLLWVVEALFALQIPFLLMVYEWPLWSFLDVWVNFPLEMLALYASHRWRWAQVLIGLHLVAKIINYEAVDCDWQYGWGSAAVNVQIQLNHAVILCLLAYTNRSRLTWLKEQYARRAEPARTPAEAPTSACSA